MKKIAYILLTLFMSTACSNVLDIEDIGHYNPDLVWNDENLANAYMANIYPMFGNWNTSLDRFSQQMAGIEFYPNRITISNGDFKRWDYDQIRLINQAIVDVNKGSLSQEARDGIIGQALFMRAYAYFYMVMYHGGVPYITVPQDRYADDLYVARNSTKECFDLIEKDIRDAIKLLPERNLSSSKNYGKIDGNFAKSFLGKVMLYKASPQFNPSNPWNNAYWKEAYDANKAAYESLKSQGYALTPDYSNIALVERGPEVIFSVINNYPDKTASWDVGMRPGSESRGPASSCPTWEFVKEFPMKDGKKYDDPTGKYHVSESDFLQNYWKNRDPRFEKSIVWNGKLYEVSGKAGKRQYTSLGIAHELDDFGVNPKAATNSTNLDRYTGFFVVKNCLLKLTQAEVQQYDVDFIVMRFAELMLNYAEAANETGKINEALAILKEIRHRAGIEAGADGNYGINASSREAIRQQIIDERNVEFCFEGHRFWDLRRLRMLSVLDNKTKYGVEAIAINSDGSEMPLSEARLKADGYNLTEKDFKYRLIQVPKSGVKVSSVPEQYYFFPIHQDVLDRNNKLEQNNNWSGTFVPTL